MARAQDLGTDISVDVIFLKMNQNFGVLADME